MKHLIYISMILLSFHLNGQQSTGTFTEEQLLWYVKNYHPMSVTARLQLEKGDQSVREARGAFDPQAYAELDQKAFDDKNYFSILGTGLKVPTWYGIELKTGYDRSRGVFLNPENDLPDDGLWFAGISVPIGQGLFLDKRRASLKQAKIFAESTQSEQRKLMNDLYFDALKQYWKWVETWNQLQVYEEAVGLAQVRLDGVRQSFRFGDIPAIDTLEALILLQRRQMDRNEFRLMYQNVTLELSNYIWFENNTPLIITDSLIPPSVDQLNAVNAMPIDTLNIYLSQLSESHPELQLYRFKIASMDVERQLKTQKLIPEINLQYNILNEPVNDFAGNLSVNNYKFGVEFSMPIFLREQRGSLQLTKLKIRETKLERSQKFLELQNKIRSYHNEQRVLADQVALFSNAVENYNKLLRGERQKFESGESSLFLVNSRETNLIQARLKLIAFISKFNIAKSGVDWAGGKLYQ